MNVSEAEQKAKRELASMPRRLAHVAAVGRLAEDVGGIFPEAERGVLISSAWLHDIGYAPGIALTGFHPLDGARWLKRLGEYRLACLVAHHTGAVYEAKTRGLSAELAAFQQEQSSVADLLTWCDLNRGPQGDPVSPEERLEEVRARYGPEHVVSRSLTAAKPYLMAACERAESLVSQVK